MGRLMGRRSTRRFRCWRVSLGALLLALLALVSLPQLPVAVAAALPAPLAPQRTLTATPTATTSTPHANPTPGASRTTSGSSANRLPSWLLEGLGILLLLLLGFGLVLVPLAIRSERIERRNYLEYTPETVGEEEQVARLSQIAPERKEPLSRAQLRALREAARESADMPAQSTASLPAVRLIKGVPVSLPEAQAAPVFQLPAPSQPAVPRPAEDHAQTEESCL